MKDSQNPTDSLFTTSDGREFTSIKEALDHASGLMDAALAEKRPKGGIFAELRAVEQAGKENTAALESADVAHFAQCASNGQHPGASSGEKACRRIAKAISALKDDLGGIDSSAVRGALALMQAVAGPWPTDDAYRQMREKLKEAAGE